MAGDFRSFNARRADLLPPCNICPSERVRTQTREIASLGRRRPLQSCRTPEIPEWEATTVRSDEHPIFGLYLFRRGLHTIAINEVSQREGSFAGLRRPGIRTVSGS